jgi:hypothetical protein
MVTSGPHGDHGLIDVTRMSLVELRTLDDHLLDESIGTVLRPRGGGRCPRWDNGNDPPKKVGT